MDLSEQQRQAVKEWLAAGASLSDVQRSLKSEFNLTLTYIDVRLLVLDIGAAVKDKPEPKPPKAEPPPAAEPEDPYADEELSYEPGAPGEADELEQLAPQQAGGAAPKVVLVIDRLVVPGAMVSGSVTFSDGVKARWLIDQMGRFGLDTDKPGYRPSNADLQEFQMQLRAELRRQGYA
jgi:hypothetical protein